MKTSYELDIKNNDSLEIQIIGMFVLNILNINKIIGLENILIILIIENQYIEIVFFPHASWKKFIL